MENKWGGQHQKKKESRSPLSQNKLKTGFIYEFAEIRNKKHPGKEKGRKERIKRKEKEKIKKIKYRK